MNKLILTATAALAVTVAGCSKKEEAPAADGTTTAADAATPAATTAANATPAAIDPAKPNDCAKLSAVTLTATIDKATNTLNIKGTATAPSTGYGIAMQTGPLDKKNPPNQIVLLRANAPEAGGAAMTVYDVSHSIANAQPAYDSVRVVCAGVPDVVLKVS